MSKPIVTMCAGLCLGAILVKLVLIRDIDRLSKDREEAITATPAFQGDPRIHPDIRNDWRVQYNAQTKRYRMQNVHSWVGLWASEADTEQGAIERLNEQHLKNVEGSREEAQWRVVK